ncbi:hypothetical protein [Flavobacterium polysaccharolyticum]|uniref:RiboL-PSP-HEPN domain-containing protein n=1 Tax=Flavobacterium polysaccharolyticum TaxID=3133148 RepID=A0ABU9NML0_9FLAO
MYINFHKYNYSLLSNDEKSDYELRDKNAYKEVLTKWFNENLIDFIDRKWEIGEIHYLKQIGDFIKLLQEAENLYELGFYTSCTALIGVSAEDFSKYLSLQNNKNEHITIIGRRGGTIDVSQYNRLKLQLSENIISQNSYDLLDEIRSIRNDCLHYNQNFKQKPQNELKNDALKVLNNLKIVLKEIIGNNIDPNDFEILLDETFKHENSRNFEELIWKHRNMFSHLLNFHIAQAPDVKIVNKYNIYKVRDLDDEEIDLTEFNPQGFPTVFVDIDEKGKELIKKEKITIGDIVVAKIYSNVDINGQTSLWYIDDIKNYNNL